MAGDSTVPAGSGDAAAAAAATGVHEGGEVGGGVGPSSGEEEKNSSFRIIDEGDRMNYAANRWPRKETLALLKIRSDMDALFRDSSHKGPLWEEVSRKLAELGYNRSARKCKEKFENVYKYHKRTKEGRTGKSEGKTYRFFDQLEAFDQNHPSHLAPPPMAPPPQPPQNSIATAAATWPSWTTNHPNISQVTVPSTTAIPMTIISQNVAVSQTTNPTIPMSSHPQVNPSQNNLPFSFQSISAHLFSSSTSSSTASDEELEGSRKRKRDWKDFFQRLTKDVIKKQEELQRKFLETVEKHERDRMAREETWRMQEMARINREHEMLVHERSAAAAKDAAVIALLQKFSGQQTITLIQPQPQDNVPQLNTQLSMPPPPPPIPPSLPPPQARPPPPPPLAALAPITNSTAPKRDANGGNNVAAMSSSSRWPKAEVHALIRLRTSLDTKYEENVPKGPLWEEISAGMQRLGYNRSAKRCKEKWENINKYFKKVKESNRKRPEDSKTCPYFHQLDALYREKSKTERGLVNSGHNAFKPMSTIVMEPLMVMPEQQWPPPQPLQENNSQIQRKEGQDDERNKMDQPIEEEEMEEEEEEEGEDGDVEEEDERGGFEMVANKPAASQIGSNGQ